MAVKGCVNPGQDRDELCAAAQDGRGENTGGGDCQDTGQWPGKDNGSQENGSKSEY